MFASKYMGKGKTKRKKDKKQFLVRMNQREQIVQQTLAGFSSFLPCVISYLVHTFYRSLFYILTIVCFLKCYPLLLIKLYFSFVMLYIGEGICPINYLNQISNTSIE